MRARSLERQRPNGMITFPTLICSAISGIWQRLEHRVHQWAKTGRDIFVITGAVFDKDNDSHRDADASVPRVKPNRVGIATHYYKTDATAIKDFKAGAL